MDFFILFLFCVVQNFAKIFCIYRISNAEILQPLPQPLPPSPPSTSEQTKQIAQIFGSDFLFIFFSTYSREYASVEKFWPKTIDFYGTRYPARQSTYNIAPCLPKYSK